MQIPPIHSVAYSASTQALRNQLADKKPAIGGRDEKAPPEIAPLELDIPHSVAADRDSQAQAEIPTPGNTTSDDPSKDSSQHCDRQL